MKLTYRKYYPPEFEARKPYKVKRNKLGGLNDAHYVVRVSIHNKFVWCPAYLKWVAILKRTRCPKFHLVRPTYLNTQICKEWLDSFMSFRKWFFKELSKTNLNPGDAQIDKDILTDFKLYSPKTCILIPGKLNSLLTASRFKEGDLPQGVTRHGKGYQAQVCLPTGRKTKTYRKVKEAFDWYVKLKIETIKASPIPYWLDEKLIRDRLLTIFENQMQAERIEFANLLNL